jgi:hypothetical protein
MTLEESFEMFCKSFYDSQSLSVSLGKTIDHECNSNFLILYELSHRYSSELKITSCFIHAVEFDKVASKKDRKRYLKLMKSYFANKAFW